MTDNPNTNTVICTGVLTFLLSLLVLFLINQCCDVFEIYLSLPLRFVLSLLFTAVSVLITWLRLQVRQLTEQVTYLSRHLDTLEKRIDTLEKGHQN